MTAAAHVCDKKVLRNLGGIKIHLVKSESTISYFNLTGLLVFSTKGTFNFVLCNLVNQGMHFVEKSPMLFFVSAHCGFVTLGAIQMLI